MTTDLYILQLQVQSFLRLEAIDITPLPGGVVELTGGNRQGKSSALKAIWAAIGGASEEPKDPIHDGEDEAKITILVGPDAEHPEYQVTKTFKRVYPGTKKADYTTTLTLRGLDGKLGSAQTVMSGWIRSITMDPVAFIKSKPEQQAETLRKLVGLDTAAHDKARKAKFDLRTEVNRDHKTFLGQLAGLVVPDEIPEPVNVEALLAEQQTALRVVQQNQDWHTGREAYQRSVAAYERGLEAAEEEFKRAQRHLEKVQQDKVAAMADLERHEKSPVPLLPDLDDIAQRIAGASAANRVHDAAKAQIERRAQVQAVVDAKRIESDQLTKQLEAMDAERARLIAECEMPLAGLAIDDEGLVTMGGKRLSQASSAEQIEVAIAIAAAQNPRLKVIHIPDASLLDKPAKQRVREIATQRVFQIWMETVESGSEDAIIIEEGRVQAKAPAAEPAPETTPEPAAPRVKKGSKK
jgi:hypothetical protein